MPFLGSIRKYIIIVELILSIPFFFNRTNIEYAVSSNIPFLIFIFASIISSMFTNSVLNQNLWMTILLILAIWEFIAATDEHKTRKLIDDFFISINIIMILSLIGILLVQVTDLENSLNTTISYTLGNFVQFGRFLGVLNSPNTLGPLAAFSAFIAIYRIKENRKQVSCIISNLLITAMDIYILLGTKSLTSIAGFCIGIGIMLILSIKKHRKLLITVLVLLAILLIALFTINIDYLSEITNRPLRTMSERSIIWKSCFTLLKDHPLTGYGSLDNYIKVSTERGLFIHPNGTHNMFIETMMLYGIPTALLFIMAIIMTIYRLLKCYFNNLDMTDEILMVPLMIFGFALLQSMMEHQMLFARTPTMIILLFSFIIADRNLKTLIDNNLKIKDK